MADLRAMRSRADLARDIHRITAAAKIPDLSLRKSGIALTAYLEELFSLKR